MMSRLEQHRTSALRSSVPVVATMLVIVAMLTVAADQPAQAQTYSVIHTFTGGMDGETPEAGLTIDRGGNLYGTAVGGGSSGYGTVFKVAHRGEGWTISPLYGFAGGQDGTSPTARVVFGPNGSLYGTTSDQSLGGGDVGTVFNLMPPASICKAVSCPWTETVLHRFTGTGSDGFVPGYGDLVFDPAGNMYGTTIKGGANGFGAVYELMPSGRNWTESVLYSFGGDIGTYLYGGVILDSAGNLYGTAYEGGGTYGTIYQLTPPGSGWTDNTLHTLQGPTEGSNPYGGLIFDQAGNLYGTTSYLGPSGAGTVFELVHSQGTWTLNVLHSFAGGFGPYGPLTMDPAGNLYGTTYADGASMHGSVFKLTPSGGSWTFTDLYDFTGGSDGGYPYGVVAVDANGNLYGTASAFGTFGYGVIWEITP